MRFQFDPKSLEILAGIIDLGGFERAAEKLNITQSAISQRIKQLENNLGRKVLHRAQPPYPTEAGQHLLGLYRQWVLLSQDTLGKIGGTDRTSVSKPVLGIGVNADSLASWFRPAHIALGQQGKWQISLHVDDEKRTLELLETGMVAGVISSQQGPIPGCKSVLLGYMEYQAMAHPDFVRRYFPAGLTEASLKDAPVVLYSAKDGMHELWLKQAGYGAMTMGDVHYAPTSYAFLDYVANGVALGMVPPLHLGLVENGQDLFRVNAGNPVMQPLYWHIWSGVSETLSEVTDIIQLYAQKSLIRI